MNGQKFIEEYVERPVMPEAKKDLAAMLRKAYEMGIAKVPLACFEAELWVDQLEND